MTDAVIVSTARTPLCKSWKGALNMTHGAKMGGHVVHAALERAKVDCQEVDDVIMGCANPEGAAGWNIARQIALRAGCPVSVPGMTVNRFCSSGLQTIALAAQRIIAGEGDIYVAGGVESISLVQNEMNKHHFQDEWLHRHKPEIYWPMLQTAEYVARRYEITREDQDRYGVQSQQRAAKARAEGKTKDEIVPITAKMKMVDKNSGAESMREVIAAEDEGIRADTTYEGVSQIKPAIEGGCIAAGNASQFSDGASACVVMSDKEAASHGLKPLGIYRGFAVAGCDPKEMGIGPVFAVPKLLEQTGKRIEDIDLWELNEAEAGYPDMQFDLWFGLMSSSRVPKDVQARLNAELNKVLQSPELLEKLAQQFYEPIGGTPERFAQAIRADMDRYGRAIKEAGIKPE
ncbi:MAG: acetyl-CoA C-acyltransferase [Betaproteobacteria bacterium]|nr:MAG: acetyl-CoA C-acyltransferase [Betaproteobacteria bacterium]